MGGGGRAEAAEGETGQAKRAPCRAGENTHPTEERGRGATQEGRGREESKGGRREAKATGRGREKEAANDAGTEGQAVRKRVRQGRPEKTGRRNVERTRRQT